MSRTGSATVLDRVFLSFTTLFAVAHLQYDATIARPVTGVDRMWADRVLPPQTPDDLLDVSANATCAHTRFM